MNLKTPLALSLALAWSTGAFAATEIVIATVNNGERPVVPRDVTPSSRRRDHRPAIRAQASASGAAEALQCGCSGGWEAAPTHREGRPTGHAR